MLFHALKRICAYIGVYCVIAVMPGVGMYVNTCIYHVAHIKFTGSISGSVDLSVEIATGGG